MYVHLQASTFNTFKGKGLEASLMALTYKISELSIVLQISSNRLENKEVTYYLKTKRHITGVAIMVRF